jgi:hypothetical protein
MVELHSSGVNLGLKEILEKHDIDDKIIRIKYFEASHIFQATVSSENCQRIAEVGVAVSRTSSRNTMPMNESLLKIVRKYGEKILLRESDRKPKAARKKAKKHPSLVAVTREKQLDNTGDWQGPPPWDLSLGGDGCPKFLCDVMVKAFLFFFFFFPVVFSISSTIKFKLPKRGQIPINMVNYMPVSCACNGLQSTPLGGSLS